jgi:RNA polymerase sigma factor (sigma-70 family)
MDKDARHELSIWMTRLADGDREPLSIVLARLLPELRRFTARTLGDRADADDAAQRALVSVFARASEFEPGRDALAWAIGIAAWECRTTLRARTRRRDDAALPDIVASEASPEAALIERDLIAAIEEATGVLAPADREALGLGDTSSNLAAATLRKRRQRALLRLRQVWSRIHGER